MPEIDELLRNLAEGKIFTTLDLSNGFLQIPLSEEAKEKTAFVTEETTAKFERMPFGLKGAPGMFQKTTNLVFKELKDDGLIYIYLDDIIISSRDWEHMLGTVRRVFESLLTTLRSPYAQTDQMCLRRWTTGFHRFQNIEWRDSARS